MCHEKKGGENAHNACELDLDRAEVQSTSQFCAEQLECMPRRHTSEVVMQG